MVFGLDFCPLALFLLLKLSLIFSKFTIPDSFGSSTANHWKSDYPDIQTVETRKPQIEKAGYELEHSFTVSEQAWKDYYEPLQERLNEVTPMMGNSQAVIDIQHELNLYKSHLGEFGYQFYC